MSYDPFNDFWYAIRTFGDGSPNVILVNVEKSGVQGRINISPT